MLTHCLTAGENFRLSVALLYDFAARGGLRARHNWASTDFQVTAMAENQLAAAIRIQSEIHKLRVAGPRWQLPAPRPRPKQEVMFPILTPEPVSMN